MLTKKNNKHKTSKYKRSNYKTSKYKTSKNKKTQNGSGILNSMAGVVFTNTKQRNMTSKIPGTKLIETYKEQLKNIYSEKKNTNPHQELLIIIYNYRTPKQIIINKDNINKIIESSYVSTVPHIQIYDINHFLFVIILPGVKSKLLWAIELKNASKLKTLIDYLLPKQPLNQIYQLLYKLYRYPNNITTPFSLKENIIIKRSKAYRKLQTYLIKNNMTKSIIVSKQISVRQDKGSNIDNIFSKLMK